MTVPQLAYLDEITPDNPVSYPDRWKIAVERSVVLNVYVPIAGNPVSDMVVRGSAVVGLPVSDGSYVLVYFEGDVHGVGMSFKDKLAHAAERMVVRYPTVAHATVKPASLCQIGTYSLADKHFEVTEPTYLFDWAQR